MSDLGPQKGPSSVAKIEAEVKNVFRTLSDIAKEASWMYEKPSLVCEVEANEKPDGTWMVRAVFKVEKAGDSLLGRIV
jgi:uncharacterized protein YndB with AHSA1/START domain